MQKLIIDLKYYFIVCLLFISIALFGVFTYGKLNFHLIINQYNSIYQDIFFKYFTNVGDGLFAVLILFILFFLVKFRFFFIGLSSFLLSGLVCQLMKKVIFVNQLRPSKFFSPEQLHYVEGVVLRTNNSFPSGHSTTAFAIFLFLAYIYKKKYYQIIFAFIACLVAYSRVYLSQHFIGDVVAGSLIGIGSFLISYFIFIPIRIKWFDKTFKSLFKNKSKNEKVSIELNLN
jgi:membrane-associated phospholipid phosphatase